MPRCSACRVETPVLDKHHVWPVQYGGRMDGKMVDICGNCHKTVHHFEGKNDLPPKHLVDLVAAVRYAKRMFEAGRTVALDKRSQGGTIKLSTDDAELLKALSIRFNTRSRAATISATIRYAARALGITR